MKKNNDNTGLPLIFVIYLIVIIFGAVLAILAHLNG